MTENNNIYYLLQFLRFLVPGMWERCGWVVLAQGPMMIQLKRWPSLQSAEGCTRLRDPLPKWFIHIADFWGALLFLVSGRDLSSFLCGFRHGAAFWSSRANDISKTSQEGNCDVLYYLVSEETYHNFCHNHRWHRLTMTKCGRVIHKNWIPEVQDYWGNPKPGCHDEFIGMIIMTIVVNF